MSIIDNLLNMLGDKHIKQADLCNALHISSSTITNWKNRNTDPPAKYIIPICDFLGEPIEKLLRTPENAQKAIKKLNRPNPTPDEEDLLNKYQSVSESSKALIRERATALFELENLKKPSAENPLVAYTETSDSEDEPLYLDLYDMPVSAGRGAYIDYTVGEPMCVPRNAETESADYLVRVSGDSMEPRFSNGDLVLVESTLMVDVGEIGIFILNNEAYIKKRGKDRLISLNEKYPDIPIGENDHIYCQGRVIGILDIGKGE